MNCGFSMCFDKLRYCVIALLVIALDQVTKVWAIASCTSRHELFPGVTCELVFNKGISWGMLPARSVLEQCMLNVGLISIVIFLLYHTYKRWVKGFAIGGEVLVIAGALSNIADRFLHGAVVDFIHVGYYGIEFPTFFNLADAAIVVGVLCMLFSPRGSYAAVSR